MVALPLLLEQSLVQVGQDLVVGQHLDQQQQLILFLELLKSTVIYLLPYPDLPLQLFHTADKEFLELILTIYDLSLEAHQFFVAQLQSSILLGQSFLDECVDLMFGGQVLVALLVELASSGLRGQIVAQLALEGDLPSFNEGLMVALGEAALFLEFGCKDSQIMQL